ncbi:MAG: hypothetical protein A3H98_11925 [Bacteroidetes bacterium RIFCSPLOWO2_02_FULL_36_8]|nr:MAG: hypothetical protein A3H98_11925 [Bacteroidetes bacterium RIFCSPLOWO2_02_FULL_36_8]
MIIFSLILLAFYHRQDFYENYNRQIVLKNLESGVNLLLSDDIWNSQEDTLSVDLFNEGKDSAILKKRMWGLYKLGMVTSFRGKINYTKVFLAGSQAGKYALYLANQNTPLSLSGLTSIVGDVFIPKRGVKQAYIEGKSFEGNKLINGAISESETEIPRLSEKLIEINHKIINNEYFINISEQQLPNRAGTIINSFLHLPLLYRHEGEVILKNIVVRGNIIIQSSDSIYVDSSAVLEDVWLIAPVVRIGNSFSGSVQIYATNKIIIDEKSKLNYPSSLCLIVNEVNKTEKEIVLKRDVVFDGTLLAYSDQQQLIPPSVSLEKGCMFSGYIYVNGQADIKGSVSGTVICSKIILKTSASVYENHLLDAIIDRGKLSPDFIVCPLMINSGKPQIVKWMQ